MGCHAYLPDMSAVTTRFAQDSLFPLPRVEHAFYSVQDRYKQAGDRRDVAIVVHPPPATLCEYRWRRKRTVITLPLPGL